uniref:Cadherin domain-containing protein n=1 Tax=Esox lucius TaxID=8010 RepID=A0A6Q2XQM6_ESOLU
MLLRFGARREQWKWVALVAVLILSWSGATAQIIYSISEEIKEGTIVGNIAKDLGIDLSTLKHRGFRIVSGSTETLFQVNQNDGILYVAHKIDREEVCERSSVCLLNLKTLLENPLEIHYVSVEVIDVNDHSPSFPEKEKRFEISESVLPGARFQLPPARDPDGSLYSVQQYKLSHNDYFRLEVKDRGEDGKIPVLNLQKPLDREAAIRHTLLLTALDGGKPPRSGTIEIIVDVLDINDNIPVFTKESYSVMLTENAPIGTTVVTVNATDVDEGSNGEVFYSFGSNVDKNVLSIFWIDPKTGTITTKGIVDFETTKAFEIRAEVNDGAQPPMTSHSKVLIEVLDVNDNAPDITVTSLLDTVKEDTKTGTAIALVSVLDKDGGENGVVKCNISNNLPFRLETNYKNYYSLVVDGPLDRESVSQYNVTITATDQGTPPLSSTSIITVHVSDVNDNPPRFSEPVINVYVKENSRVGEILISVCALDADSNEHGQVSYSLLESTSNSAPLSTMVTINSLTGDIISLQSFNYEEIKTFQFKVQATDSGVPPLSSNVTVNVFILDENDNSPGFLSPHSDHGSVITENIPYSAEAGYFVAKIRAVDADSGYNALLSYHITEPKGTNLFRIGTSTGELRTKRRMSDNDLKTHPLVVLVSDNGEPSLSATVSIDVVVVESTSEIQTQIRNVQRKGQSFSDLNLYLLISIASVSVIFLLSLISLIAVKCHRTEDSFRRYSAPMITTHPDGSWSYSKSTHQYDVCFSSDTLKSDVVVFPASCPPADDELICINENDTFNRTQTLPNKEKANVCTDFLNCRTCLPMLKNKRKRAVYMPDKHQSNFSGV